MDEFHIMTPDEIDALFKDDTKEEDNINPGIRVTFIKAERQIISPDRIGCVIKCAIWNDSPKKISLPTA